MGLCNACLEIQLKIDRLEEENASVKGAIEIPDFASHLKEATVSTQNETTLLGSVTVPSDLRGIPNEAA